MKTRWFLGTPAVVLLPADFPDGVTPLDIAKNKKFTSIERLLNQY